MEKIHETEKFFSELGEDIERAWKHHPPIIELRGWWWKKYIPHYQRMREVMQTLIEHEWAENYQRIDQILNDIERRERREYGRSFGVGRNIDL